MSAVIPRLVAIMVLAGCGALPGLTPTAPAATQTPGRTDPAEDVVMCTLMPLGDVQAKSPFHTPLAEFEEGTVPGMCEYRSAPDAEEPVSVLLVVTDFSSAGDANTSLTNQRQNAVDAGIPVSDQSGLGERAFASGSDEVGVHAVVGNRLIDANMGGEWPDTTDDAKVAAGVELIRQILERLP